MSDMHEALVNIATGNGLPVSQVEQWILDKEYDRLYDLAAAITHAWNDVASSNIESHYYKSGFYGIVNRLVFSLTDISLQPLERILALQPHDGMLIQHTAAKLAMNVAPTDLNVMAESPHFLPLWECLVHEMVIGGVNLLRLQHVLNIATMMKSTEHPLSVLPLRLIPVEQQITQLRRKHRIDGSATAIPFGPSWHSEPRHIMVRSSQSKAVVLESTTMISQMQLMTAFENWRQESNGKIEPRQFLADNPISDDALYHSDLLLTLGLQCVAANIPAEINLWKVTPDRIINILFAAASNGGAYNNGVSNSYGRLYAWTSVAALMNMPVDTPIVELADHMFACSWFEFEVNVASQWFDQVAWDVGMIGLSRDRRVLTALAATDTD